MRANYPCDMEKIVLSGNFLEEISNYLCDMKKESITILNR